MKYNIWHVEMYAGWSDYDGPEDCNIKKDIIIDARFNKEQVKAMLFTLYPNSRTVAIHSCELVKNNQEIKTENDA